MPRTLIRKNPSNFKTLPLHVEATPEGLSYQSVGMPLNFAQTLQRRKPVEVADPERFVLELANLGVSVRLTLHWQNKDYWVLVRQRRQGHWTAHEREHLRSVMRSASSVSPYLLIWVVPGSLLLLPFLAWFIDRRRKGSAPPDSRQTQFDES